MRLPSKHRRAALRATGAGALLAMSIGLSGCHWWEDLEPGENLADKYGEFVGFCGFLQECGSHSDPNQGGQQTATGTSSDDSSGNSTNTGDENATAPEDD